MIIKIASKERAKKKTRNILNKAEQIRVVPKGETQFVINLFTLDYLFIFNAIKVLTIITQTCNIIIFQFSFVLIKHFN